MSDLLTTAKALLAYYDRRDAEDAANEMVGTCQYTEFDRLRDDLRLAVRTAEAASD